MLTPYPTGPARTGRYGRFYAPLALGMTALAFVPPFKDVVVVVRLGRPYPLIAVDSRGAFSKLGRKLFGDGQAATGNDEFDRRFRIATKEPAIARQVVGPQLIAAHLAGTVPAWTVSGPELLTYREGTIDRPDRIPVLAEPTLRIADLLGR